ncbi:MAG: hypothetical protein ACREQD_02900, partial [Candidatus Binataceae bacterium]
VEQRLQKLPEITERLVRVEEGVARTDERLQSFRNEAHSEFATVHSEIKRFEIVAELRERLATVEAKLAAQPS